MGAQGVVASGQILLGTLVEVVEGGGEAVAAMLARRAAERPQGAPPPFELVHLERLKDLEAENARLRRAVSDLALDKMILAEAARGTASLLEGWWKEAKATGRTSSTGAA
jgi:hypothetical protein